MINPLSPDSGIYIESHPINDIDIFDPANMASFFPAITGVEAYSPESNEIVLLPDTDVAIKDQLEDSGFVIVDINDEQISDIAMQAILHSSPVVIGAGTHRGNSSMVLDIVEKELSRQKFLFDVETTKKPEPFCGFRENKREKFKRIRK